LSMSKNTAEDTLHPGADGGEAGVKN